MPHRRASKLLCLLPFIAAGLMPILLSACGAESPGALQGYNAAIGESSISGISSGGFMATQFGTAWSSVIKGVGIIAGGPYYCAQASSSDIWNGYTRPIFRATGACMKGPPPDIQPLIDKAEEKASAGEIDPTSNLSRQKVYVFHGFNDTVVSQPVTDATKDFYRHYLGQNGAGNLFYQTDLGSGHAQILAAAKRTSGLNSCAVTQSPYINDCGYDQAGVILQHIYGALNPPNYGKLSGTLKTFSQSRYTGDDPGSLSMGDTGYVFVPKDCEAEQAAPCRVHIALHGCKQDTGDIGTLYVDDSGYNAWADTNRIIILYPQTAARPLIGLPPQNPQACWDWWSYITHDDSYVTKSGMQIKAIKAMLDALTAGYKPGADKDVAGAGASPRLTVIDISDAGADLAWTPVPGADGYSVSRAESGGELKPVATVPGPSFADNGLQPSTAYRWRVSATGKAAGASVSLETAARTPVKPPPCDNPGSCPLARAMD